MLQIILALKQVRNHPAKYFKRGAADAGQSGKAERLFDLLNEIHAAQKKVLIVTQFREMGEWWNPAVEAQATNRTYRIGQQRNVRVHRLITRGTFEARINDMIRAQQELAEMTVGTGEIWVGHLQPQE